jgi:diaminopropionate ammonia-lyase
MPLPPRTFPNPLRRHHAGFSPAELAAVAAFAPDRQATPLHDARDLAAALGLSSLLIKDESARWGLNAFKITGVSYALHALGDSGGRLVCASAGNHGRAVARVARERGVPCRVHLPADALAVRVAAIRGEGAEIVSGGSYEDAVARAEADARASDAVLVSDTALFDSRAPAPDDPPAIPDLIVRGYTRLFSEAAAVWDTPPNVFVVQGGVGGLVGAAAGWLSAMLPTATLIAAEPHGAACLMASARAGRPIRLPSTEPTSMVCLRCAQPNAASWPYVAAGVDAFVTVSDEETADAVAALGAAGLLSGAAGACGFAALAAIAPAMPGSRALVIVTEGP